MKCNRAITEESIHACGGVWHKQCFTCTLCNTSFPDKKFFVFEGRPYCLDDYYRAANAICTSCTGPIQGTCVQVQELNQARFHPDCWRCAHCSCKLTDVYFSYKGLAYCENDINAIYHDSSSSSAPASGLEGPVRRQTLLRNYGK